MIQAAPVAGKPAAGTDKSATVHVVCDSLWSVHRKAGRTLPIYASFVGGFFRASLSLQLCPCAAASFAAGVDVSAL